MKLSEVFDAASNEAFHTDIAETQTVRDDHFDQICALRMEYELAMCSYIEKYILDGQSLIEIFPVAHRSSLEDIFDAGCVYGHYVLEHIIEYEKDFSNKAAVKQCYESMVKTGRISPRSNH